MVSSTEDAVSGTEYMVSRIGDAVSGTEYMVSGTEDVVSSIGDVVSGTEYVVSSIGDMVSGTEDVVFALQVREAENAYLCEHDTSFPRKRESTSITLDARLRGHDVTPLSFP